MLPTHTRVVAGQIEHGRFSVLSLSVIGLLNETGHQFTTGLERFSDDHQQLLADLSQQIQSEPFVAADRENRSCLRQIAIETNVKEENVSLYIHLL